MLHGSRVRQPVFGKAARGGDVADLVRRCFRNPARSVARRSDGRRSAVGDPLEPERAAGVASHDFVTPPRRVSRGNPKRVIGRTCDPKNLRPLTTQRQRPDETIRRDVDEHVMTVANIVGDHDHVAARAGHDRLHLRVRHEAEHSVDVGVPRQRLATARDCDRSEAACERLACSASRHYCPGGR